MDFLNQHFETSINTTSINNNRFIYIAIQAGYTKFLKYQNLTEKIPVYIAAIVLNLQEKQEYFKNSWSGRPDSAIKLAKL